MTDGAVSSLRVTRKRGVAALVYTDLRPGGESPWRLRLISLRENWGVGEWVAGNRGMIV